MKNYFFPFLLLGGLFILDACHTTPLIPLDGIPGENGELLCADGVVSFQYEILPLMVSNCAFSGCHDAVYQAEGVILDTYENISKEVKAGKPNRSELYKSITDSDDDIMPPPPYPPLSAAEIELVKNWILQGAANNDCALPCSPDESSFATAIMPTIQSYCVGCHNDNLASGNINLKDYDHILPYVENGSLLGSIQFDPNYSEMPPSGGQLNSCQIEQVTKWIEEGAKNN